jgi:alpha-glucosidase
VGVLDQAEQNTDWSEHDGLPSVLPAKLTAGLSGVTQLHSGVGGWSSPSVPLMGASERSDELLARWAELEAFGSLLRSEDGAEPAAMEQVWDSSARAASFARATRLFAALAPYRRQVTATAAATGLPVVRPFWLEDTNARQAGADDEYFFGSSLLVVPVLHEGQREVRAALPAGRWVELFSGRTYSGPPQARPTPTRTARQTPAPPVQDPDATLPPRPLAVTIPAPLGQPVVLYRAGDAAGEQVRALLDAQGLLPGRAS